QGARRSLSRQARTLSRLPESLRHRPWRRQDRARRPRGQVGVPAQWSEPRSRVRRRRWHVGRGYGSNAGACAADAPLHGRGRLAARPSPAVLEKREAGEQYLAAITGAASAVELVAARRGKMRASARLEAGIDTADGLGDAGPAMLGSPADALAP